MDKDILSLTLVICFSLIWAQHSLGNSNDMRVVCYVGTWSIYRSPDRGYFDVPYVDVNLCTHIMYAFVGINNETGTIMSIDPERDYQKSGFKDFVKLKEKNAKLKVMIAVGGWNEGPAKFSKMASNNESRRIFIQSAVEFIRENGFDGFDIDWEYPGHKDRGGNEEDRRNLNYLAQELRNAMPKNWELSIALGAEVDILRKGYDLKTLSRYIDFFSVTCYNYHGDWEQTTAHNSPLYSRPTENVIERTLNMNYTVHLLLRMGIPRKKITIGIPLYGNTFVLEDPNLTDPGSPTKVGKADVTPFSVQDDGSILYFELCTLTEEDGWTRQRDRYQMVPYMYRNYTWISFDDPKSTFIKARYALENGLGGVMVWALDTDDFQGNCSNIKFPLVDAILKGLGKRPVTNTDVQLIAGDDSSTVIVVNSFLLLIFSFCLQIIVLCIWK